MLPQFLETAVQLRTTKTIPITTSGFESSYRVPAIHFSNLRISKPNFFIAFYHIFFRFIRPNNLTLVFCIFFTVKINLIVPLSFFCQHWDFPGQLSEEIFSTRRRATVLEETTPNSLWIASDRVLIKSLCKCHLETSIS